MFSIYLVYIFDKYLDMFMLCLVNVMQVFVGCLTFCICLFVFGIFLHFLGIHFAYILPSSAKPQLAKSKVNHSAKKNKYSR